MGTVPASSPFMRTSRLGVRDVSCGPRGRGRQQPLHPATRSRRDGHDCVGPGFGAFWVHRDEKGDIDCEDEGDGILIRREFSFLPLSFRTHNVSPKRPTDVATLYANCKSGLAPRLLRGSREKGQQPLHPDLCPRRDGRGCVGPGFGVCSVCGDGKGAWATRRTGVMDSELLSFFFLTPNICPEPGSGF